MNGTTSAATSADPQNNLPAIPGENAYCSEGTVVEMSGNVLTPAFGGGPHNNMQPFLTVSFIIALQGIYPPRP
jgi:microcystin-dependent protein